MFSLINGLLMIGLTFLIIGLIIILPFVVIYYIGLAKVFQKADKPWWAAIIPFYSTYVYIEITGLHWMYFLFMISGTIISLLGIPGLGTLSLLMVLYARIMSSYNLAKKFGKEGAFCVLIIFFKFIMIPIMGFSKEFVYNKDIVVSEHGLIGDNNNNNNNIGKYCTYCGKKVNIDDKFCQNCGNEIKN